MKVARHEMPGKSADMFRPVGNGMIIDVGRGLTVPANTTPVPTDQTVPYGTGFAGGRGSRHFIPGYHHGSLRDKQT
jgi:hypothetical protein